MTTRNYSEFGIFGAFNHPVVAPLVAIDGTPTLGILVNEEWIPLVSGAIKGMLRDALWSGDLSSVANAVDEIDLLVSSWQNLINPGDPADWLYAVTCANGILETHNETVGIPGITGNYGYRSHFSFWANSEEPIATMELNIQFTDLTGSIHVGVPIDEWSVETSALGDLIHVQIIDCLDVAHFADLGNAVYLTDVMTGSPPWYIKSIDVLSYTDSLTTQIRGYGAINCSPA